MKSTIVEVTNGERNWGKFVVAEFDEQEWNRRSVVDTDRPLLRAIGYGSAPSLWVLDLQTGEGAYFRIGGNPKSDLNKHKVWVCPMFEPFLGWLYQNWKGIDQLPAHVDLPDAPFSFTGYRREGTE